MAGGTQYWSTQKGESAEDALTKYVASFAKRRDEDSSHSSRLWDEDSVRFAIAPSKEDKEYTTEVGITSISFFDVSRVPQPQFEIKAVGS
jgi:hypothetical protein